MTRDTEVGLYSRHERANKPGNFHPTHYELPYKPEAGSIHFIRPTFDTYKPHFTIAGIYCKDTFPNQDPLPLMQLTGVRIERTSYPIRRHFKLVKCLLWRRIELYSGVADAFYRNGRHGISASDIMDGHRVCL